MAAVRGVAVALGTASTPRHEGTKARRTDGWVFDAGLCTTCCQLVAAAERPKAVPWRCECVRAVVVFDKQALILIDVACALLFSANFA